MKMLENKKGLEENIKKIYFVEKPAEKDLIGLNTYIETLDHAINNDAKFIGLISDFGSGKSTLINLFKKIYKKKYDIQSIDLWNYNSYEYSEENDYNIHKNFLFQLSTKISSNNQTYFRKKLNSNYGLFDIGYLQSKLKIPYILISLCFILAIITQGIFNYNLFVSELRIPGYLLVITLAILSFLIHKPVIATRRTDNGPREINENDTISIYKEIIENRKNKKKKLLISIEELDRYEDKNYILTCLKEFYKFYSETKEKNIVFIVSLKSANDIICSDPFIDCGDEDEPAKEAKISNEISETKKTYEKVFDFIINLKEVYIDNFDYIVMDLLNDDEKKIFFEENKILLPNENNMNGWDYLYKGNSISIRDIKHRYNFSLLLFQSIKENGIEPNMKKCLYISFLEDEYNRIYQKLISSYNMIPKIIELYKKSDFDEIKIKLSIKDDRVNEFILEGLENKYISTDYNIYFFKYPIIKKPLSTDERNFYNCIFYEEKSLEMEESINNLEEEVIIKILNMRTNELVLPSIIFENKKLFGIVNTKMIKELKSTLKLRYPVKSDFSQSLKLIEKIIHFDDESVNSFLRLYNEVYAEVFLENNDDEIILNFRESLIKLVKNKITIFENLYSKERAQFKLDEIKNIDNLEMILKIIKDKVVGKELIEYIIDFINSNVVEEKQIIDFINYIDENNNIEGFNLFAEVNEIKLSEKINTTENKSIIYNMFEYSTVAELIAFIKKLNYFNTTVEKEILEWISRNDNIVNEVNLYYEAILFFNRLNIATIKYFSDNNLIYNFPEQMQEKIYKNKKYNYYLKVRLSKEKRFRILEDKNEIEDNNYINVFTYFEDWEWPIEKELKYMLFNNIEYNQLSLMQLNVFADQKQNAKIIGEIISKNDEDFINSYLQKISSINRRDESEIFNMFGEFRKTKNMKPKAYLNLKRLNPSKSNWKKLDKRSKVNALS